MNPYSSPSVIDPPVVSTSQSDKQGDFFRIPDFRQKWQLAAFWWQYAWQLVAILVIYPASLWLGGYLFRTYGAPLDSPPGVNPPWYFIRQDFFQGLGLFIGLAVIVLILAVARPRFMFANLMLFIMVSTSMIPGIMTSVVIYFRCFNFFDYRNAVSPWTTFNEYNANNLTMINIKIWFGIMMTIMLGLFTWNEFRKSRRVKVNPDAP